MNSYEGGRFVQEVHDDYIVQEETGRIDFGYIATMSEVCRKWFGSSLVLIE